MMRGEAEMNSQPEPLIFKEEPAMGGNKCLQLCPCIGQRLRAKLPQVHPAGAIAALGSVHPGGWQTQGTEQAVNVGNRTATDYSYSTIQPMSRGRKQVR
jgi:hypothetical protein